MTAVEVANEVAAMLSPLANVAEMVRSATFARLYLFASHTVGEEPPAQAVAPLAQVSCTAVPDATAIVWLARPFTAVKVTDAATSPLLATAVVKVVQVGPRLVPTCTVGEAVPVRVQNGRETVTESPTARSCDIVKPIVSLVAWPSVGVPMVRELAVNRRSYIVTDGRTASAA